MRFTHITGCDSGFILIHYSSNLNANDSLPKDMLDVNRTLSDVTVGVDFGSTNTSVAYHDGQMQYAEGIQFTGQRVSLFTDLGANANQAPAERNVLFFQNEDLYSNAIKSILAIHDDQRLPKMSWMVSIPCAVKLYKEDSHASAVTCLLTMLRMTR